MNFWSNESMVPIRLAILRQLLQSGTVMRTAELINGMPQELQTKTDLNFNLKMLTQKGYIATIGDLHPDNYQITEKGERALQRWYIRHENAVVSATIGGLLSILGVIIGAWLKK